MTRCSSPSPTSWSGCITSKASCRFAGPGRSFAPEESAQLTAFAKAQEGKHYALWRLLLQGTPCRLRNGLTEKYIARTHLDRSRWLCTEIVVAAGTLVGLFDDSVKGNACYPLDMLDDQHKYNLGKCYDLPGYWATHP